MSAHCLVVNGTCLLSLLRRWPREAASPAGSAGKRRPQPGAPGSPAKPRGAAGTPELCRVERAAGALLPGEEATWPRGKGRSGWRATVVSRSAEQEDGAGGCVPVLQKLDSSSGAGAGTGTGRCAAGRAPGAAAGERGGRGARSCRSCPRRRPAGSTEERDGLSKGRKETLWQTVYIFLFFFFGSCLGVGGRPAFVRFKMFLRISRC